MEINLSNLTIEDAGLNGHTAPNGVDSEQYLSKLKTYADSLPYSVESDSKMQEMLDFILLRLCQCIEAKDYDPGLLQYDSMIT